MADDGGGDRRGGKAKVQAGAAEAEAASVGAVARPADVCLVCTEPWNCCGEHRICCIPCGHVYGRSCLETWLTQQRGNKAKCPQCKEEFAQKDIINLLANGRMLDGCFGIQELKREMATQVDEAIALINSQVADEDNAIVERVKAELDEEKSMLVDELRMEFDEKLKQEMMKVQLSLGKAHRK